MTSAAELVVVPLTTSGARVAAEVPAKARGLRLLGALGLPVPKAFAVVAHSDAAWHSADATAVARALGELGQSLAVRSSAADEDAAGGSQAGRYDTRLGVRNTLDEVLAAARFVTDAYPTSAGPSCIIVQDFVEPAYGGVLFTQRTDAGHFAIVEWDADQAGITGGSAVAAHAEIDLDDPAAIVDGVVDGGRALLDAARLLEESFPTGVDVEWLVSRSGMLHLLQVRAVTAALGIVDAQDEFARDIDHVGADDLPADSALRPLVASFNVKRRWARLAAKAARVDIAHTVVITARSRARIEASWIDVSEMFLTPLITLKTGFGGKLSHAIVATADVPAILASFPETGRLDIYAAEYFEPTTCGLVGRVEGGGYLVEFVAGDIQALYSGDTAFSTARLDEDGRLLDERLVPVETVYRLDRTTGTSRADPFDGTPAALEEPLLRAIVTMCDVASRTFGEARVEWLAAFGRVVMFDLSIESAALPDVAPGGVRELSPGAATGPALVVTTADIERLRSVITLHRSVIPSAAESAALAAPEVTAVRDAILGRATTPPVIVTRFPDLALSVFLDAAVGFVFEAGAVLSHFGIILREAGVPAIMTPAASEVRIGDQLWIDGTHLRRRSTEVL